MRKLTMFNFTSLNGFFKGPNGDLSWHKHGEEEGEFSKDNMKEDHILLFGRVTYEMMAGFWPSPMAKEMNPVMSEAMTNAEKIVFSRSLEKAEWKNTTIIRDNIVEEMKKLKQQPGKNMTILGSGSIVSQFAEAGIIDGYQIMVDPVVIANGTSVFPNIQKQLDLKLVSTRTFKSGVVLLSYEPG